MENISIIWQFVITYIQKFINLLMSYWVGQAVVYLFLLSVLVGLIVHNMLVHKD